MSLMFHMLSLCKKHNTTSMFPVGFEPMIPASARPQTCALDRAATGIGLVEYDVLKIWFDFNSVRRATLLRDKLKISCWFSNMSWPTSS
jgi:hypothetical protein